MIFHHFPMGVPADRYIAIELAVHKGDLKSVPLYVLLYGDNKKPYPAEQGLVLPAGGEPPTRPDDSWSLIRLPLSDFRFTESRIMGICIRKDPTPGEGTFYLDCIRFLEE